MFDSLFVANDIVLPIDQDLRTVIDFEFEFQTKSFDCTMQSYFIKNNQLLTKPQTKYVIPKEQRPYPNADGLLGLCGSIGTIFGDIEKVDFTGYFEFYSHLGKIWLCFLATCENGNITSIKKI